MQNHILLTNKQTSLNMCIHSEIVSSYCEHSSNYVIEKFFAQWPSLMVPNALIFV